MSVLNAEMQTYIESALTEMLQTNIEIMDTEMERGRYKSYICYTGTDTFERTGFITYSFQWEKQLEVHTLNATSRLSLANIRWAR